MTTQDFLVSPCTGLRTEIEVPGSYQDYTFFWSPIELSIRQAYRVRVPLDIGHDARVLSDTCIAAQSMGWDPGSMTHRPGFIVAIRTGSTQECPSCGEATPIQSRYCGFCGAHMETHE